jgi:hypothetical protein
MKRIIINKKENLYIFNVEYFGKFNISLWN